MSAWRDGEVLTGVAAELARDRGLLLGDGLFETLLVRDGAAPLLERHIERMRASAAVLGLTIPVALTRRVDAALDQRPRAGLGADVAGDQPGVGEALG